MLIKSALLTSASGSVGGMTAAHNRGGLYLRSRVIPTDPATLLQLERRLTLSLASGEWRTLGASAQDAWKIYADAVTIPNALGDPVKLSGQQHYVRYRTAAYLAGATTKPTTGPTILTLPNPPVITTANITAAENLGVTIALASSGGWQTQASNYLVAYIGRPQGPGIGFYRGPWRYGASIPGNTTPPATLTINDATVNGRSALEGEKLWLAFRIVDTNTTTLSELVTVGPVTVGPP